MVTIQYILDHPDEFDKDAIVVVLPRQEEVKPKEPIRQKRQRKNCYTQFSLFCNILNSSGFNIDFYEKFKEVAGLNREDINISYQVTEIWFCTSSQRTLDRINKAYGTKFDFQGRFNYYMPL